MANYMRGRDARLQIDSTNFKAVTFTAKIEREEHAASRYEDSGWSRRTLGLRSVEIQFEAVWPESVDLLGYGYLGIQDIAEEDEQDEGWALENVKLWPDLEQESGLYLELPKATLLNCEINVGVADKVTVRGTIKNQGYAVWHSNT